MSGTTRRNSWMLAVAVAGVLAVGVVAAQGRAGRGKECGGGPTAMGGMREVLSQLDLTVEQKTGIKDIVHGQRPIMEPLADQAAAARKELFQAVHASTLDEGAVRAASDRLAKVQLALALERARTVSRVREVLSPEQLEKLDVARAERLTRMDERGRHVRRMMRDHFDDSMDSF